VLTVRRQDAVKRTSRNHHSATETPSNNKNDAVEQRAGADLATNMLKFRLSVKKNCRLFARNKI